MSAKKFDSDKPDLSLCPKPALAAMARAFMHGEKKYGRYNYLTGGMTSSRLVAACMRHITDWQDGEDIDADSGNIHLGNAMACLAMLIDQMDKGVMVDNRRGKAADVNRE